MNFKKNNLIEILESLGLRESTNEKDFEIGTYHKNFEENEEFKIIWTIEKEGKKTDYFMWFNEQGIAISGVER